MKKKLIVFRKLYLEKFKAQVKGHLENIEIVDKKQLN